MLHVRERVEASHLGIRDAPRELVEGRAHPLVPRERLPTAHGRGLDRHYFPPYEAAPVIRRETLARPEGGGAALDHPPGRVSAAATRRPTAPAAADHRRAG